MEHPRLFIFFVLLVLNALCYAAEPPAPDNEKLQAFNASYAEFEDLLKTERIEQALQKCREAFELAREIFGESHKTTAELSYNYGLLLNKVGYYPLAKDILSEALKTLASSDINFEAELKQFLPRSQWAIIRNFKSTLETEINRFI